MKCNAGLSPLGGATQLAVQELSSMWREGQVMITQRWYKRRDLQEIKLHQSSNICTISRIIQIRFSARCGDPLLLYSGASWHRELRLLASSKSDQEGRGGALGRHKCGEWSAIIPAMSVNIGLWVTCASFFLTAVFALPDWIVLSLPSRHPAIHWDLTLPDKRRC